MPATTTIKVPSALRDRLALRAERERIPLAQVIERALDENEDREFWARVRDEHAQLGTAADRTLGDAATLRDDLADAADDMLSEQDEW